MTLKKVFIPFAAVAIVFGGLNIYKFSTAEKRLPESWLIEKMPTSFKDYSLQRKTFDSPISYEMDESTYDVLKPIGIACLVWKTPKGSFDVVVIASSSMASFHDQKICFNAQGWSVNEKGVKDLQTDTHGTAKFYVMELGRENMGDSKRYGIYGFRPPTGFANYEQARLGFMINEIKTGQPGIGYSYRFIGLDEGITEQDVFDFAKEYLARANENSGGVL